MSWKIIKYHQTLSKLSSGSCHQMSRKIFQFNMVTFHDIWWYLVTFHDIWRFFMTKPCCLSWYAMTCHDKSWIDSIWFGEVTHIIPLAIRQYSGLPTSVMTLLFILHYLSIMLCQETLEQSCLLLVSMVTLSCFPRSCSQRWYWRKHKENMDTKMNVTC